MPELNLITICKFVAHTAARRYGWELGFGVVTTETDAVIVRFAFDFSLFIKLMTGNALLVLMLLMREFNRKLCDVIHLPLPAIGDVAETRKQKTRSVFRRHIHVAV